MDGLHRSDEAVITALLIAVENQKRFNDSAIRKDLSASLSVSIVKKSRGLAVENVAFWCLIGLSVA